MSVSLEPVDVPETVESETTPTPTQIEESEGITSVSAQTKESVAAQQITDEAPEGNSIIQK